MTKAQTEIHAAVIKLIANLAQRTESHAAQLDQSTGIRAADAIAPLLKALSDLEVIHLPSSRSQVRFVPRDDSIIAVYQGENLLAVMDHACFVNHPDTASEDDA